MLNLNNKELLAQNYLLINNNNNNTNDSQVTASSSSLVAEPVWKVLIYDQLGQDIISPILKVNDLRENGVTVHM